MLSIDLLHNMDQVFMFILIATALALAVKRWNSNNRSQQIPGPKGHWLTGIRIGLPFRSQDAMRQWALDYGELFQIRVGWYHWVVVNSPEAMKEIFDKQVSFQYALQHCFSYAQEPVRFNLLQSACANCT